jgi:hypothetical protein
MFFSGQNLLYTFHQSLTAQHVTVGMFKRYARSPEHRTFKNYFRSTKRFQAQYHGTTDAWLAKMCLRTSSLTCLKAPNPFTKYMHQRPQNALSRYIAKHRRRQNPILATFTTRIATTIMEKLQNLQIHYPAPAGREGAVVPSEPSPLGPAKVNRPFRPSAERTESAAYLSPGHRDCVAI